MKARKIGLFLSLPMLLLALGCNLETATESSNSEGPGAAAGSALEQQIQARFASHDDYRFAFDLQSLDGQPLSDKQFRGQVLIVDIWGTWCPPCRAEVPHFVALQEQYGDRGLQIVGLNYERRDSEQAARDAIAQFTQSQPINYPLALGTEAIQAQVPDFRGYPTTLFIDREGTVQATLVGAESREVLEAMVKAMLDAPTSST